MRLERITIRCRFETKQRWERLYRSTRGPSIENYEDFLDALMTIFEIVRGGCGGFTIDEVVKKLQEGKCIIREV